MLSRFNSTCLSAEAEEAAAEETETPKKKKKKKEKKQQVEEDVGMEEEAAAGPSEEVGTEVLFDHLFSSCFIYGTWLSILVNRKPTFIKQKCFLLSHPRSQTTEKKKKKKEKKAQEPEKEAVISPTEEVPDFNTRQFAHVFHMCMREKTHDSCHLLLH